MQSNRNCERINEMAEMKMTDIIIKIVVCILVVAGSWSLSLGIFPPSFEGQDTEMQIARRRIRESRHVYFAVGIIFLFAAVALL